MKFNLQLIDFVFTVSFSFQHFQSDGFVFFAEEGDGLFKVAPLLHILCSDILDFPVAGLQILF